MFTPVLSILVISHNQRDLLKRCIQSVLAQKLNVPYEVVVSDDRSTDGTWELIEQYVEEYSGLIFGFKCNSDECNPDNVSDRCGWNKLNAYNHARGEYFVNIDADDYLRSDDIYQQQLDMLQKHPDCSMCMQDIWQVNDGEPIERGFRWPVNGSLANGSVFSEWELITKYRALNQAYMIRRRPEDNMKELYGKYFDDTIITLHHLQYGPCVYIDRADYAWIKYQHSITGSIKGDDSLVEYSLLPLHHVALIPKFAGLFMKDSIRYLASMFKALTESGCQLQLSERTLRGFSHTDGFIYEILCKQSPSIIDKCKIWFVRLVVLLYSRFSIEKYGFLYRILTNNARYRAIPSNFWKI